MLSTSKDTKAICVKNVNACTKCNTEKTIKSYKQRILSEYKKCNLGSLKKKETFRVVLAEEREDRVIFVEIHTSS